MAETAKAQEPSMEEILASIRRIIADDDASKAAKPVEQAKPAAPDPAAPMPVAPAAASVPPPGSNKQTEIDTMLAKLDVAPRPAPPQAPAPPPAPTPEVDQPAAASQNDVLDLTEAMAAPANAPAAPPASFRTIAAASDVVFTEWPPGRQVAGKQQAAAQPSAPDQALISASTMAAVDGAFNSLAHIVLGQNARTLEDLVKDMLRPMLKSWLDDNLPGVVDRIVRAEIERVSRGR